MKKIVNALLAAVMIVSLTGCSFLLPKEETSNLAQNELWEKLKTEEKEVWSSGEYYLFFGKDGNKYTFRQQKISDSSSVGTGDVTAYKYLGENVYRLTVSYSSLSRDVNVEYDASSTSRRIRVLTYLNDGNETQNQTYRIISLKESSEPVDPDPGSDSPPGDDPVKEEGLTQGELWTLLTSADSWTNEEEEFVNFLYESHSYKYMESTWGAGEGLGYGDTDNFRYEGNNVYSFSVHWVYDDYEEEESQDIDGVIKITYDKEKDYILVSPYSVSQARYYRDVNSQMTQSQVWKLLNGAWYCDSNETEFEFVTDQITGEMYINYKADGQPQKRTLVYDFHGEHYIYSFAMILYNQDEIDPDELDVEDINIEDFDADEVLYCSLTFNADDLSFIEIDERDYQYRY